MADASDIYRRFLRAPLRLKTATPPPSPAPSALPSPRELSASTRRNKSMAATAATAVADAKPGVPEVKRLRRRVAKIHISTARKDDVESQSQQQQTATSDTESSSATSPTATATRNGPAPPQVTLRKPKKKRVTRAIKLHNTDTGGDFIDTPTKASEPPKRSRRSSRNISNDASDTADSKENASIRRNLGASLLEVDSDDSESEEEIKPAPAAAKPEPARRRTTADAPRMRAKPDPRPLRRSRRLQQSRAAEATLVPAPVLPVVPILDKLSTLCDSLLATHTVSGCFFALAFNALRPLTSTWGFMDASKPLQSVFDVCLGIAQCEKLAQDSQMQALAVHSSSRRGNTAQKRKKSVRFRSFDLSCLSLQYVEDERLAAMVDELLTRYDRIMTLVQTTLAAGEQQDGQFAALRELARVMISSTLIYHPTPAIDVAVEAESDAAKRIFSQAFDARDAATQHEIRVCGDFFGGQFASLLAPRVQPASPPRFLQGMFSTLVSSSARFKLRALFLVDCVYDDDGERVQEQPAFDADGRPMSSMAVYDHQDLGSAVHCALQETLLYAPLVRPVLALLATTEAPAGSTIGSMVALDPTVKKLLDDYTADDLDRVEQYVLARRFLRFQLTKSWRSRQNDQFTAEMWHSLEKACAIAKRSNLEDEAHLFPLAAMDHFLVELADEEFSLRQLERILQAFHSQEETGHLRLEPCMECRRIIAREEDPTSIKCILCGNRYHLSCLHLPDTFAQFAGQYTCPSCFLGRGY